MTTAFGGRKWPTTPSCDSPRTMPPQIVRLDVGKGAAARPAIDNHVPSEHARAHENRTTAGNAARNPAIIRDLDPHAPSLEGYLFPDTYKLGRKTTPERLCRIMTGKFREVWKGLGNTGSVHDAVTLASLVEKEGKLPQERPQIASDRSVVAAGDWLHQPLSESRPRSAPAEP